MSGTKFSQGIVASFLLLLSSCAGFTSSDASDSSSQDSVSTFIPNEVMKSEIHPIGIYVGIVSATDNQSYHRTLSLNDNSSYTMSDSTEYNGKPKVTNDSGEYNMNKDTVILDMKSRPALKYLLTGDILIQLDDEGKPSYPPGTLTKK